MEICVNDLPLGSMDTETFVTCTILLSFFWEAGVAWGNGFPGGSSDV
jgi:hypothetical protein